VPAQGGLGSGGAAIRPRLILALFGIGLATAATAASPPRDCLTALDGIEPETKIELAERCPELPAWLARSGYGDAVDPPLSELERAGRIRAALELIRAKSASATPAVNREQLVRIVAEARLSDKASPEPTLWDRFKRWLTAWLPSFEPGDFTWLADIIRSLGWLGQALVWLGYALLVAALAACLWLLLPWLRRALVALTWRSTATVPGGSRGPAQAEPGGAMRLDAIADLAAREQPSALLRLAIASLQKAGKLPRAPGRTDAELAAALDGLGSEPAERFRRLADRAERALYGGSQPDTDALTACFDDARALVDAAGTGR